MVKDLLYDLLSLVIVMLFIILWTVAIGGRIASVVICGVSTAAMIMLIVAGCATLPLVFMFLLGGLIVAPIIYALCTLGERKLYDVIKYCGRGGF